MVIKSVIPQKLPFYHMFYNIKTSILHTVFSTGLHTIVNHNKTHIQQTMKKKFTSMLLLLVSFVMSAMAQQVASTPTAWSDIQSGNQYLVLVKSNLTSENGNFMYLSTTDKYAHVDGSTEPKNFIGAQIPITEESEKYIWFVTKNGDKITINSRVNNTGFAGTGQNDNSLNLSGNLTTYDVKEETDGSVTLSYYGSYWSWSGTKHYTTYITSKEDSDTGGFCTSTTKGESTAKFVFYEIEQPTIITYNYTDPFDHKIRYSYGIEAYDGQEYPESPILDENLPEYVSYGDVYQASGIFHVGTSQTSFNFELSINLPFTTSTDDAPVYYYFVNGTDTRYRLSGSDISFRNEGQAEQLNDVRNDLWYVKGNPWDGYQFVGVASGHVAKSSAVISGSSLCNLAFNGAVYNTDTWQLVKIDDDAFAVYGKGYYWNLVNSAGKVRFTNSFNTTDATKTFRLIPATITLPLNYSEADAKTFATTCLPYAVEVAEGQESIKAYAGKLNDDQTELNMNAVTAVPANQGVILSGENAGDTEVVLNVLASADDIDNDLLGTTSEMSTDGILALGRANGSGNVGFFRSTNATLKANRAYLMIANEAIQALAMNFGGTTTGINNANKHFDLNAPIYDLSGRRVFTTVKGNIYLQQGRKFIAQ